MAHGFMGSVEFHFYSSRSTEYDFESFKLYYESLSQEPYARSKIPMELDGSLYTNQNEIKVVPFSHGPISFGSNYLTFTVYSCYYDSVNNTMKSGSDTVVLNQSLMHAAVTEI